MRELLYSERYANCLAEEPAEEPAEPDGAEGCSYNASTQSRTRAVQGLKVQFNGKRGEANVSWNEIPGG